MKKSILCLFAAVGVVGYCGTGFADDWEDRLEDLREAREDALEERQERIEDYYDDLEDYYEDLEDRRGRRHRGYYRPRRSFGFSLNLGRGYDRGFYRHRPFYGPRYAPSPFGYRDRRYDWPPRRGRYFDPYRGYCW